MERGSGVEKFNDNRGYLPLTNTLHYLPTPRGESTPENFDFASQLQHKSLWICVASAAFYPRCLLMAAPIHQNREYVNLSLGFDASRILYLGIINMHTMLLQSFM